MKRTPCFLLCLSVLGSLLTAQPGTWRSTSALRLARDSHTATVLPDGRVLVVGGRAGPTSAATPEVEAFDPTTETWTRRAPLRLARTDHTASLLRNGRVLVVGGRDGGGVLGKAEIYNPVTNIWTAAKDLNMARAHHQAEVLLDGRVLVSGGFGSTGSGAVSDAEIFDPSTGNWTVTASLHSAREQHASSLMPNGRVLVTGGISAVASGQFSILPAAEIFDPIARSWSDVPPMSAPRAGHTSTLLQDGRVLVFGGDTPSSEVYDPASARWILSGDAGVGRTDHSSTLLGDGRVLAVGGFSQQQALGSAELYDPITGTWTSQENMSRPRGLHTASLLPNGLVLIAGGRAGSTEMPTDTVEIFDPAKALAQNLLVYPQLALGAGFDVILFVTNTSSGSWTGLAELNGGSWPGNRPWSLNGETRTGESSFALILEARQTRKYRLTTTSGPYSGWLEIRGLEDSRIDALATAFFYNFLSGSELVDSTGVPPAEATRSAWFPVEKSALVRTGMAIRRSPVPAIFSLFDADGDQVAQIQQVIDGATFVDQLFQGIPDGFVGSVHAASGVAFHITVLRQEFLPGLPLRFQLTNVPPTTMQETP